MPLSREQMLVEMGISPLWTLNEAVTATPAQPEAPAAVAVSSAVEETAPGAPVVERATGWPGLLAGIADCKACALCRQRRQVVPGVGDRAPDWLFIGEGPGAEEDARGEPFVGQAGKLLDAMLAALDLSRHSKVYIANAVKCRPPNNRTPEAAEMAACRPWLEEQIALLKPKVIVLLGKAAAHTVLGNDGALAGMRGKRFEYEGIPVAVTYHPAYLLRNQVDKGKAWADLLFARSLLRTATG